MVVYVGHSKDTENCFKKSKINNLKKDAREVNQNLNILGRHTQYRFENERMLPQIISREADRGTRR